jgi:uncharacterized protein
VIAYFDTSALIPLIIDEPSSGTCLRLWNDAERATSVRLLYPEARAALARAQRMRRITNEQLHAAITELDSMIAEIDHIEVTRDLAHTAGELAQAHALRGSDAVHLAAVLSVADTELVLATGDADLTSRASSLGISVALMT